METNKKFYTIEDLINLCKVYKDEVTRNKNLTLDIKAMKHKIEIMVLKIKNAKIYIDEIDKHNKSIFDFWKFTNKDNALALNEAEQEEVAEVEIEKTFDYEEDFEELGKKADIEQRKYLTKDECDSIYVTTNAIEAVNIVKKHCDRKLPRLKTTQLQEILKDMQSQAQSENNSYSNEEFDIFGGISNDKTKIKSLDGKRHRELEKDKYRILNINKNTDIHQFIDTLREINIRLEEAMDKSKSIANMGLYISAKSIVKGKYNLYNIMPENTLKNLTRKSEPLVKINIKEDMPAIYLSNIEDLVLLDNSRYNFTLKKSIEFKINKEIDGKMKVQDIQLDEYDLTLNENTEEDFEEEDDND